MTKQLLILLLLTSLSVSEVMAAPKKGKGCSRAVTPAYQQMKRNWQKVPSIPEPKWKNGYRDLTLYAVNLGERFRFFPYLADGTLDPAALDSLAQSMADKTNHHTKAPHPRLVKLIYKLAVHFKARQINVISGYREPAEAQDKESHHADGSAIDIMIPGVPLAAVAKVARTLGHTGIGFYPTSGFVHIDVRSGSSYFWADPSGPGKPGCLRRILVPLGPQVDRRWRAGLDEPVPQKTKLGNLLGTPEAEAEAAEAAAKKTAAKKAKGKKAPAKKKAEKPAVSTPPAEVSPPVPSDPAPLPSSDPATPPSSPAVNP